MEKYTIQSKFYVYVVVGTYENIYANNLKQFVAIIYVITLLEFSLAFILYQ